MLTDADAMHRQIMRSADTHPVEQRSSVKYEWKHKRSCSENFTPLWELQLQEPVEKKEMKSGINS